MKKLFAALLFVTLLSCFIFASCSFSEIGDFNFLDVFKSENNIELDKDSETVAKRESETESESNSESESVNQHGHEIIEKEVIAKQATCYETGLKYVVCEVCNEVIKTILLDQLQHNYISEVTAPTCLSQGYTTYTCSLCGDEYVSDYASPLGHNYVGGVCTRCGAQESISGESYTRDGDYIYFGSYPQTKVTDSSITSVLNGVAGTLPTNGNNRDWTSYGYYISSSNTTDYMWYIDITYSGNKYRGVYFTSYRPYWTDYPSSTDYTYQDDNGYYTGNVYWFKYEPIKWQILEETTENGKKYAKMFCCLAIDSQEYYHNYNNRTINGQTVYPNNYAESNIRKWLNDNFYNTAFNSLQKNLIQTIEVDNSARSTNPDNDATYWNSGNNKYACENTYDKVWLLSLQEVTRASYGFDTNPSAYGVGNTRIKMSTDYAKAQGCWQSTSTNYRGACWWWLRSPRYKGSSGVRYVYDDGGTGYSSYVDYTYGGVLPALQICLD